MNPVPTQQIQNAAAQAPGSVWYVLGEPNGHGVTVEDVVVGLHDTYEVIKQADPSARITSPSILNFNFTCTNCGGYQSGSSWINNFWFQYTNLYGEDPPIDIWAIDTFPIVWPDDELPVSQAFPTVRDDIVAQQVTDYRVWLDARQQTRGKPIWVTEFGLHWGFPDLEYGVPGCTKPSPKGEYLATEVKAYLARAYSWFEANSSAMNIQRWFTFSTYKNIDVCQADSGNGLSLLDNSGGAGNMTEVGIFFKNWILGFR
ncbi:MAG: glycosyl hydrolase [Chloroflexi bacterium]|nr:glycosyl hydrolase [Chloroflexota bacterium]